LQPIRLKDEFSFSFGGLLTPMEKTWLAKKIENFLDRNSPESETSDR
jgi:hypothetical protein